MDEGVDGIILENMADRLDTVEQDVGSYLDNLYEIEEKIETVLNQTNSVRYQDVPILKLALTMIFLLGVANTAVLLLIVFHIGT